MEYTKLTHTQNPLHVSPKGQKHRADSKCIHPKKIKVSATAEVKD